MSKLRAVLLVLLVFIFIITCLWIYTFLVLPRPAAQPVSLPQSGHTYWKV
jgi:uncharacterized SAM-binding protein YcdF (DUF218 family)